MFKTIITEVSGAVGAAVGTTVGVIVGAVVGVGVGAVCGFKTGDAAARKWAQSDPDDVVDLTEAEPVVEPTKARRPKAKLSPAFN